LAKYPAIDVRSGPADVIPAIVDDFRPTAIEERADAIRVFFTDTRLRDAAGAALSAARYSVRSVDVDDEDWARRSQENLEPITVGCITIVPSIAIAPRAVRHQADHGRLKPAATDSIVIVIQPSMGFGTGHHATTRLCLRGLQALNLSGRFVLDVGTGSGVLAIAAVRLGAARAVGIDNDADAIQAANENLQLNFFIRGSAPIRHPKAAAALGARHPGSVARGDPTAPLRSLECLEPVEFQLADLSTGDLPQADVVTANLTGALLIRSALRLLGLLRPEGILVVSGLLDEERDDVVRAFRDAVSDSPSLLREQHEDGWAALAVKRS
jgi:ribosomal protein L11 methylase PrmA